MAADTRKHELHGIGGWLILFVIGLAISPLRIATMLIRDHLPIFSDGTWQALTSMGSEAYHPLWAPLLAYEILGNMVIALLAAIVLCFLLAKSRHTPRLAIVWLAFGLVFIAGDFVMAGQIPAVAAQPTDYESIRELFRSIVSALIWIPYFLVSERVRVTFSGARPATARASVQST